MAKKYDMFPGTVYGNLIVLGKAESTKRHGKSKVRCCCGKQFEVLNFNLRNGKTTSCGCKKSLKSNK